MHITFSPVSPSRGKARQSRYTGSKRFRDPHFPKVIGLCLLNGT